MLEQMDGCPLLCKREVGFEILGRFRSLSSLNITEFGRGVVTTAGSTTDWGIYVWLRV